MWAEDIAEWRALPWQDKRPDVGSLNYLKGQNALSASESIVGKSEGKN